MSYTTKKIRKTMLRGGRVIGEIAWDWLKQQPPVQKQMRRVEEQVEQVKRHVKQKIQIAEEEFWQWVKELESESQFRVPRHSGPSLNECYQILEVSPKASWKEVRNAWRIQMRACHPDQFAQNPEQQQRAEIKARQVNEAFQKLKAYYE